MSIWKKMTAIVLAMVLLVSFSPLQVNAAWKDVVGPEPEVPKFKVSVKGNTMTLEIEKLKIKNEKANKDYTVKDKFIGVYISKDDKNNFKKTFNSDVELKGDGPFTITMYDLAPGKYSIRLKGILDVYGYSYRTYSYFTDTQTVTVKKKQVPEERPETNVKTGDTYKKFKKLIDAGIVSLQKVDNKEYVIFGKYDLRCDLLNGHRADTVSGDGVEEWLYWEILKYSSDGNAALITTRTCVNEFVPGNPSGKAGYKNTTAREYLTGEFYEEAFCDRERDQIMNSNITLKGSKSNEVIHDKIFCLSSDEIKKYYPDVLDRYFYTANGKSGFIILRNPELTGSSQYLHRGEIDKSIGESAAAVKPALWINLEVEE